MSQVFSHCQPNSTLVNDPQNGGCQNYCTIEFPFYYGICRIPNCPTVVQLYLLYTSNNYHISTPGKISDTQKLREPLEEPARALGIDLLEESAEICHAAAGELLRRLALAHSRHDVAGVPGSAMGFHHGMPMVSWAKTMENLG